MPAISSKISHVAGFRLATLASTQQHAVLNTNLQNKVYTTVDHAGLGTSDILMDYVRNLFDKSGYSNVNEADSRFYHNWSGDIHCGTNKQRTIPPGPQEDPPGYDWWQ